MKFIVYCVFCWSSVCCINSCIKFLCMFLQVVMVPDSADVASIFDVRNFLYLSLWSPEKDRSTDLLVIF